MDSFFNSRISPSRKNSTIELSQGLQPKSCFSGESTMDSTPPKLLKAAKHTSVFGKQLLGRNKLCVQAKLMTAAEIQSSTLPEVVHQQESR